MLFASHVKGTLSALDLKKLMWEGLICGGYCQVLDALHCRCFAKQTKLSSDLCTRTGRMELKRMPLDPKRATCACVVRTLVRDSTSINQTETPLSLSTGLGLVEKIAKDPLARFRWHPCCGECKRNEQRVLACAECQLPQNDQAQHVQFQVGKNWRPTNRTTCRHMCLAFREPKSKG